MTAIISVKEQIWVQSRKSRWAFLTLISGRISSKWTFQLLQSYLFPSRYDCSHIWTPLLSGLQSYLDLNKTKIAVINGPLQNQDCSHIWTLIKLKLQSYLDLNISDIALILGPPYNCQSKGSLYHFAMYQLKLKEFLYQLRFRQLQKAGRGNFPN